MPRSDADAARPLAAPSRWRIARRTRRSLLLQALAALAVLAAWQLVQEDQWHAELTFANYDCTRGEVCRLAPHIAVASVDATGAHYRYTTNAAGFRSPELPPLIAEPGVFRIAVLGSSPIFGLGVNDGDTFPEALRDALRTALPGRRLEVLNFGLPMNYFASELITYSTFARAYRPDLVVFVQPWLGERPDMNDRVLQITRSPLLTAMLPNATGRRAVNRFQFLSAQIVSIVAKFRAPERLRARARVLLEDQSARGTRLYFYDFFDDGNREHLDDLLPRGLRYDTHCTGLSYETYRASPHVIPMEGHPTASGQHYFAGILAARLVPIIAGH